MNNKIIDLFEKLINVIKSNLDDDKIIFRLSAISKALQVIKKYPKKIKSADDLKDLPGIGKGTLNRVNEILKTGSLKEVDDNEKTGKTSNLDKIHGIGTKFMKKLIDKYNIKNIKELKKAYAEKKIKLPKIVEMGLKYPDVYENPIPRKEMIKFDKKLHKLIKIFNSKLELIICGSYRRGKDFSSDIDVLIFNPQKKTMSELLQDTIFQEFLTYLKSINFIIDSITELNINTKYMGYCTLSKKHQVRRIDIRYLPYNAYYAAILYFTGSKDLNQTMRSTAKKLGFRLNEYGLFNRKTGKQIVVKSEKDIFDKLNLEFLEPKDR